MPCYRWDGGLPRSAAHGTVWPSESRPHCTTVDFFASVGKETRRADSTAGGNLIKWTPSRGVSSTFPMYDLVKMEKSKAANVTTGLYHESDDGNAGFGGSPSG